MCGVSHLTVMMARSKASDPGLTYTGKTAAPLAETNGLCIRTADGAVVSIEPSDDAGKYRLKLHGAHPIERLYLDGELDTREFEAGMKFHALWRRAVLTPQLTAVYDERRGNGGGVSEFMDARKTLHTILLAAGLAIEAAEQDLRTRMGLLRTVHGRISLSDAAQVVVDVCGLTNSVHKRKKPALKSGLSMLASYWGLVNPE